MYDNMDGHFANLRFFYIGYFWNRHLPLWGHKDFEHS